MSESLSRLERDQLRKFAQYLIAKLPEQILPVAQNILDDLLSQAQTGNFIHSLKPFYSCFCPVERISIGNSKSNLVKFCVTAKGGEKKRGIRY